MFQSTSSNTVTFTGNPATITLGTHGSSRLVINSSGNIGIGTINPSQKLDIRNTPLEETKREILDFLFNLRTPSGFIEFKSGFVYGCLNLIEDIMIRMDEREVIEKIESLYSDLNKIKMSSESRAKLGSILDTAIEKSWFITSYSHGITIHPDRDPKFQ